MRRLTGLLAALACAAACASACASGPSTLSLTAASVDSTYFCPGGASNAAYDLHATVEVHNGTAGTATIYAVAARMTLAAVTGDWLEKVGDHYDAAAATFSPTTVPPGATRSVKATIPSACTSGPYGTGVSSSADYDVTIRVATSAGSDTIAAANQHEIIGA